MEDFGAERRSVGQATQQRGHEKRIPARFEEHAPRKPIPLDIAGAPLALPEHHLSRLGFGERVKVNLHAAETASQLGPEAQQRRRHLIPRGGGRQDGHHRQASCLDDRTAESVKARVIAILHIVDAQAHGLLIRHGSQEGAQRRCHFRSIS